MEFQNVLSAHGLAHINFLGKAREEKSQTPPFVHTPYPCYTRDREHDTEPLPALLRERGRRRSAG